MAAHPQSPPPPPAAAAVGWISKLWNTRGRSTTATLHRRRTTNNTTTPPSTNSFISRFYKFFTIPNTNKNISTPTLYVRTRKRFRTVTWRYKKTIGTVGSFVFLVNQIFGAGLVSIPGVMTSSGWLPSLVANILVCVVSSFCTLMLMRATTMIPGNQNFEQRFEYGAIMKYYLPNWLAGFVQVANHIGVQCGNVVCIIAVAQVVDQIFVFLFGFTYGIHVWPPDGPGPGGDQLPSSFASPSSFLLRPHFRTFDADGLDRIYTGSLAPLFTSSSLTDGGPHHHTTLTTITNVTQQDQGLIFAITLGYIITMIVCIRLSAMNLEENMKVQLVSFCIVLSVVLQLCFSGVVRITTSAEHHTLPFSSGRPPPTSPRLLPHLADTSTSPTHLLAQPPGGGILTAGLPNDSAAYLHPPDVAAAAAAPSLRAIKFPSVLGFRQFGPTLTTFLDGYQFVVSTPSWANEMTDDVAAGGIVWKSTVFSCAVYYIWGLIMATAHPAASESGSNVLHQLLLRPAGEGHNGLLTGRSLGSDMYSMGGSHDDGGTRDGSDHHQTCTRTDLTAALQLHPQCAPKTEYKPDRGGKAKPDRSSFDETRNDVGLLSFVSIYIFLLIAVLPRVVMANMSSKYNLINTALCNPTVAFLVACVGPFCFTWLLATSCCADVLGWIALWTGLLCNFIAPSSIYIIACKHAVLAKRNPVRRRQETMSAATLHQVGFKATKEKKETSNSKKRRGGVSGALKRVGSKFLLPTALNQPVEGITARGAGGPQYGEKVREVQRALQDWLTEFAKQEGADEDVAMLAQWCPEFAETSRDSEHRDADLSLVGQVEIRKSESHDAVLYEAREGESATVATDSPNGEGDARSNQFRPTPPFGPSDGRRRHGRLKYNGFARRSKTSYNLDRLEVELPSDNFNDAISFPEQVASLTPEAGAKCDSKAGPSPGSEESLPPNDEVAAEPATSESVVRITNVDVNIATLAKAEEGEEEEATPTGFTRRIASRKATIRAMHDRLIEVLLENNAKHEEDEKALTLIYLENASTEKGSAARLQSRISVTGHRDRRRKLTICQPHEQQYNISSRIDTANIPQDDETETSAVLCAADETDTNGGNQHPGLEEPVISHDSCCSYESSTSNISLPPETNNPPPVIEKTLAALTPDEASRPDVSDFQGRTRKKLMNTRETALSRRQNTSATATHPPGAYIDDADPTTAESLIFEDSHCPLFWKPSTLKSDESECKPRKSVGFGVAETLEIESAGKTGSQCSPSHDDTPSDSHSKDTEVISRSKVDDSLCVESDEDDETKLTSATVIRNIKRSHWSQIRALVYFLQTLIFKTVPDNLYGGVAGMEDSYVVDEDPSTGKLKHIRVHVFPAGFLRRHHLTATYAMLTFLVGMSAIGFALDVYSRFS